MRILYLLGPMLIFLLLFRCFPETNNSEETLEVIPLPQNAVFNAQQIFFPQNLILSENSEKHQRLTQFIQTNINKLFSREIQSKHSEDINLSFLDNPTLGSEAYILNIQKDSIIIEASEDFGFIRAAATLLQLPDEQGRLSLGKIEDAPDYDYRAVMIDCSRSWYSVATLKQIIDLCFWYKIKYLHLHLTDDALFTFPTENFPKLPSNPSYSKEDLIELNEYANSKGCILIPEIDVPGHSSGFVAKYPVTFGLQDKEQNYWTINMGKESAYVAINSILKEVAEAFPYSPYIHVGGDEFSPQGMMDDPDVKAYMLKKNITNLDDLYHHFILRVTQMVKDLGKTPIIWSDFTNKGAVKIPNDVLIMVWKTGAFHPDELVKDGFKFINASWHPLYVVNNRKWSPEEIYNWTPRTWKGSQTPSSSKGVVMNPHSNLIGSSMSVWEQNEYKAIISLRDRLSVVSEKLWNKNQENYSNFVERSAMTDKRLNRFLHGFQLNQEGLTFPDWKDSNFDEHMWYKDSLNISAKTDHDNIAVKYQFFIDDNLKRKIPENGFKNLPTDGLIIKENGPMVFQAFQQQDGVENKPIGHPIFKNYSLHPILIETQGLISDFLPHAWGHHKFIDSLKINLNASLEGEIYYTLDNSVPTKQSIQYKGPFYLKESGRFRAQLFSEETGGSIGRPAYQEYVKLGFEKSLTTGKVVSTSNGEGDLSVISHINDGQIARWDHWGDHKDDENWVIVDLGKEEEITRFKTYTFWDGSRYYEYTIEVSTDKKFWKMVVDRSKNKEISTAEGTTDSIDPTKARYLKLNLIRNSANPGLHVVEFNAF